MPRLSSARAAVSPPIPAPAMRTCNRLLDCCDARVGDDVVLRSGPARNADGADDLAVHDDRVAAARRDHAVERRQVAEERSAAEQALEIDGRTTEGGRRFRLVLRD